MHMYTVLKYVQAGLKAHSVTLSITPKKEKSNKN